MPTLSQILQAEDAQIRGSAQNNRYLENTGVVGGATEQLALEQRLRDSGNLRAARLASSEYNGIDTRPPVGVRNGSEPLRSNPGDLKIQPYTPAQPLNTPVVNRTPELTDEEIRQQELAAVQAQIDSVRQVFAARRAEEQVAGKDRLGQTRGLNAASGATFSTFGTGSEERANAATRGILNEISSEEAQTIANILAAARGEATRKIEKRADQSRLDEQARLDQEFRDRQLRLETERNARIDELSRAQLTGTLNGEATLGLRSLLSDQQQQSFNNDLATRQFGLSEADLALRQRQVDFAEEEARATGGQLIERRDGSVLLYDPYEGTTRTIIGALPRTSSGSSNDSNVQAALAEYVRGGGSLDGLTSAEVSAITNTYLGLGGGRMSYEPGTLFPQPRVDNFSSDLTEAAGIVRSNPSLVTEVRARLIGAYPDRVQQINAAF